MTEPATITEYQITRGMLKPRIEFVCPRCASPYSGSITDAGTRFTCPACESTMYVPGEPELAEYEQTRQARRSQRQQKRRAAQVQKSAVKKQRMQAKSVKTAQRQRLSFLNPKLARNADDTAFWVHLFGSIAAWTMIAISVLSAILGIITIIGIIMLPACLLLFITGVMIGIGSNAVAAHLRNNAAQTRLLAQIVDRLPPPAESEA